MWFKKKKDVDLRELHKKGLIRIPKEDIDIKTDRFGFIEVGKKELESTNPENLNHQELNSHVFDLFEETSSKDTSSKASDTDRELTRKLEELDNKLYKLEQRIELLEKKGGVGNFSKYSWE